MALHSSGLSLRLDRPCCIEFEGASRHGDRAGADEDLSRRRTLLQPGTDVDGVACDEGTALARPADDDVAGVDADAHREPVAEDVAQPSLHTERGMQGPLGVVLERRRRTEDRHHGVAGELLDGAAGSLDLVGHRLVEAVEQCARSFSVLRGTQLRRAGDVGEQNRHQLALALLRLCLHRRRACGTEASACRDRGPTR